MPAPASRSAENDPSDEGRFAPETAYAADFKTTAAPRPSFRFEAIGSLQYRAPEYLVEGLIETATLGLIFGEPGCGKTFVAVDIALSVASGTPFHGRSVKKGPVFFIAGEGHNGLIRRCAAWAKARDVSLQGLPMFKSERAAQFLDGASAATVAEAVDQLADMHGSPALIVVDTLARNFGAGDENNTKDMSEFVTAIDNLKARYPGCAVLIVHHSGHADRLRARGAIALKGALDVEFRIQRDEQTVTMINTKMKDAEPPADLCLTLERIELEYGVSSAVLSSGGGTQKKVKVPRPHRLALDTYRTAAVADGTWEDGAFRGVHLDAWRPHFYEKHTGENSAVKRQAFKRARDDLVEAGQMTVCNDVYLVRDSTMIGDLMGVTKRDKA